MGRKQYLYHVTTQENAEKIKRDGNKETAEERCISYLKDRTDKEGEKDNA